MKKLILLLLLLITPSLYALDCSVEAGIQDKKIAINNLDFSDFGNYFVEIELYQKLSIATFYGIYRNEMEFCSPYFKPRQDYFTVGVSLSYLGFILDVSHECDHAVGNFRRQASGIYGGYSQISIKYSSK